ncbi:MAG: DUF4340 domain-containing protein [Candidatus Zixiibacteriota bacterium]
MKKPIHVLVAILVVFVMVYLLLMQKERKKLAPGKVENFLDLDSALVSRIEFNKFDTKLILQKVNQQWYLTEPDSYKADNDAVGSLLGTASHLEVGEVISSNREKQPLFLVDNFSGTRMEFFAGENRRASVIVGKMSSDFLHAYVRKTDSDEVYLAQGSFAHLGEAGVNQWRNRAVLSFDPMQVKEIQSGRGKDEFKLSKVDTAWQISRVPYQPSYQADGKLVGSYIQSLASMKADEFARKPEIEGIDFTKPEFWLALTFADGHVVRLSATSQGGTDSRYYVKTDQDRSVFVLFEYTFKRLAKTPDDFRSK